MPVDWLDRQVELGLYTRFEDFYFNLVRNGYVTKTYPSELFFLFRLIDGLALYAKKKGESVRILELGAYHGVSAMIMARALERRGAEGSVITVDRNPLPQPLIPVGEYIQFIQGDVMKIADDFEDESMNLIFIDDTHEYHHLKRELELCYPKVISNKIARSDPCNATVGGIVCGHDYSPYYRHGWNVMHAVEEFKKEHDWIGFGTENRIWWMVKGNE